MDQIDCIVVGAGAVGLAAARRLAQAGQEVLVLEATGAVGQGVSSRSSEVVHAGIYYPKDSLKARLCRAGGARLYDFCAEHGVESRRLGKFIVATSPAQLDALKAIHAAAIANGVDDIEVWSPAQFHQLEPEVVCELALFSPSTGIFDSRGYVLALQGDVETAGGTIVLASPFEGARCVGRHFEVDVGGAQPTTIRCRRLVNAAGLSAVTVARSISGLDSGAIPTAYFAQGAYFAAQGVKTPFQHLIYPIPEPGGLGVHVTLDLGGQARFGPDVRWIDRTDYRVEDDRVERFYPAIRNYWPNLPDGCLVHAYSGVRPKISGPAEPAADFHIQGPGECGVDGLVNLFGIESPGLTASLAIADHVAALLERDSFRRNRIRS